jgi:glycosyltransferase involved in cell wall biosynthesis
LRILHLTSDWKWTGPAEPMLLAGEALRARGHRVELVAPEAPTGERGVLAEARLRGVEPALVLERGRGIHPWRDRRAAARLRRLLDAGEPCDVVHVWHTRAHGLALRARGLYGALIRAHSNGLDPRIGERWLFGRGCDALVCTSEACAATHAGVAHGVAGAVDLDRFRPARSHDDEAQGRKVLSIEPGTPAIGVVARVQGHRRFDLLLDAMQSLAAGDPGRRLVVLGRGTHLEDVAGRPVRERGLEAQVVVAGHLEGDDYAAGLRSLDVLCFLVPGSDGGCRAVLEAAASGVPAVVSKRRGLSEWVADGETGYVVEERSQEIAAALARLLDDPDERARMGAAARARSEARFSSYRLGEELERVYAAALQGGRGRGA